MNLLEVPAEQLAFTRAFFEELEQRQDAFAA
jgi:hypothetical protein